MGAAYRASGRTLPVMDGLAFHPYADTLGPVARHAAPELDHDRARRLRPPDPERSATAFDGTAAGRARRCPSSTTSSASSPRSRPERRRRTPAPSPRRRSPSTRSPRAPYYAAGPAARVLPAERRPGIFLFHTQDEPALASWQSGVYYADGTPKSSLYAVRDALGAGPRRARSPAATGSGSTSRRRRSASRRRRSSRGGARDVRFTCTLDCVWELRVSSAATGDTRAPPDGLRAGRAAGRRLAEGPQARHGRRCASRSRSPTRSTRACRRPARARRSASASARAYHERHERAKSHGTSASRASRSASTSPTASSRSTPPGGACRSRSARRARTPSPRSSRTGRAGWRGCAPTTSRASGPRPTSSSGRSPSATTTCSSSAPRSTARRSPAG